MIADILTTALSIVGALLVIGVLTGAVRISFEKIDKQKGKP